MHICFSSDSHYVQHLGVTLISLLEHNRAAGKIHVYIIDGGITPAQKAQLEDLVRPYDTEMTFLSIDSALFQGFMVDKHITLASYYRIVLPDILPPQVEKILYLDCDLLVLDSLRDLWHTDLGETYLAAVPELDNFRHREMGSGNIPYFNAGVLLMNLAKWREASLTAKTLAFIRENPDQIAYHDQDALNKMVLEGWTKLDVKWNLIVPYIQERARFSIQQHPSVVAAIMKPSIVHFNQSFKPWHYKLRHPYKYLYYQFLNKTPWKDYKQPDKNIENILRFHIGKTMKKVGLKKM
ncbi:MAG: glycosyltransferase family 8 protein [Bacteroidota bacterium]